MIVLVINRIRSKRNTTIGIASVYSISKKIIREVSRQNIYTLENTELKLAPGTYPLSLRVSEKFGNHYIVDNTTDRNLILIHPLNNVKETHGCIGAGFKVSLSQMVIWETATCCKFLLDLKLDRLSIFDNGYNILK